VDAARDEAGLDSRSRSQFGEQATDGRGKAEIVEHGWPQISAEPAQLGAKVLGEFSSAGDGFEHVAWHKVVGGFRDGV